MADSVVVATVAETARLRLRTWGPGDADAFYAVMNHEPVMRYLGGVQSRDHWQMVVDRVTAYQAEFGYTFWIVEWRDRKSTRLNSSHGYISYAVFCLKKKKKYKA